MLRKLGFQFWGVIWSYYGHLRDDLILLISNIAGVLCGCSYFITFCVYANPAVSRYYTKILFYSVLIGLFAMKLPDFIEPSNRQFIFDWVGLMASITSVALMSSPLCSIRSVLTQKSTESMSFLVSCAMSTNGLTWSVYGFVIEHGNAFIIVPNVIGFIAGCFQMALFCMYPSPKDTDYIVMDRSSADGYIL